MTTTSTTTTVPNLGKTWSHRLQVVDGKIHQLTSVHIPWALVIVGLVVVAAASIAATVFVKNAKKAIGRRKRLLDSAAGKIAKRARAGVLPSQRKPADWNGSNPTRASFSYDHALDLDKLKKDIENDLRPLFGPGRIAIQERKHLIVWRSVAPTPDLPKSVSYDVDVSPTAAKLPFAVDAHAKVLYWDQDNSNPHALVAGSTGGGKSVCAADFILGAHLRGDRTIYVDPKREAKAWFRPALSLYASAPADMNRVLLELQDEMLDRARQIDVANANGRAEPRFQRTLLVIDEWIALAELLRESSRGKPPAESALLKMTLMGRSLMFNILIVTQDPNTEWLKKAIRNQLGCRIVLGRTDADMRKMMQIGTVLEEGDTDIPGRAVARLGGRESVCQIWFADEAVGKVALKVALRDSHIEAGQEPVQPLDGPLDSPVDTPMDGPLDGPVDTPAPKAMPAPLSQEKVDAIARGIVAGLGDREIARTVQVSPTTVGTYRRKLAESPLLSVVPDLERD